MNEKNRVVQVDIFGQVYSIRASVRDEEYIQSIARYIDGKMRKIDKTMKPNSAQKVAILAALNVADELHTLKRKYQEQSDRLAKYKEKIQTFSDVLDKNLIQK